jgi:hypothetical protein
MKFLGLLFLLATPAIGADDGHMLPPIVISLPGDREGVNALRIQATSCRDVLVRALDEDDPGRMDWILVYEIYRMRGICPGPDSKGPIAKAR